jgi:predicted unusual protein kinase regulating ubiquinone biosynthesis (AarF/ABC1/UbiB family)
MKDVDGLPAMSMPEGMLRTETAHQLIESFCQQIVVDGFFHADLHPGNLMWQPIEQRLYFLDLGMVGEVDPQLRDLVMLLLIAFWQKDADFLTDVILTLSGGMEGGEPDAEGFGRDLRSLMDKYRGVSVRNIQLGPLMPEMINIAFRHGVRLPASLTLMAKALAQMQQAAAQLDPDLDPFDVAGRFLMRSVIRRIAGGSDATTLFYQAQKLRLRATRILEGIETLVGARPGQKPDLNFGAAALEQTVRQAGRRLALGLTGGFAILASTLAAPSARLPDWVPAAAAIAGAAFAAALVLDLLRRK